MPSPLTEAVDASMRRVLKATWSGTVREGADYYCCEMDVCGHHTHVSEEHLRSPLLCMTCVREKIGPLMPKIEVNDEQADRRHT
jgi:hypothetical protein